MLITMQKDKILLTIHPYIVHVMDNLPYAHKETITHSSLRCMHIYAPELFLFFI